MNSIPHKRSNPTDSSTASSPWFTFGLALTGWVLMLGIIAAGSAFILMGSHGFPEDFLFMMLALIATVGMSIVTLSVHLLGSIRCLQVLREAGHRTRHTLMLMFHVSGSALISLGLLTVLLQRL